MIHLISREEIFFKSSLVDHYISQLQRSKYKQQGRNLDAGFDIGETDIQGEDPYDHLESFHDSREILNDFAVISYREKNRIDYLTHRSMAFIRFFGLMAIDRLYLMDELKYDLVSFPFSYREKREAFKNIVNQATYSEALELDIEELSKILPLFHYSKRHSTPIIWLFSGSTQVPFVAFLCDDANFHTSFLSRDKEKLFSAASAAGLTMGGIELC
jgi:hypothetical protein